MKTKTLFFDCSMGAAGDMITAALLELVDDPGEALRELNSFGIPGVEYTAVKTERCGIVGNHVKVLINGEVEPDDWKVEPHEHHHHGHGHHHHHHHHGHCHHHEHDHAHHEHDHAHHDHDHMHHEHDHAHHEHDHAHHEHDHAHAHRGLEDIKSIIDSLNVTDTVKENAYQVYALIAEAESHAHGHPVTEIHFHEVGKMDAIADVVAACHLIKKLDVDKVLASPVAVGNGYVRCAHGVMAVPAPATLHILHGVPIYAGEIPTESCTPTGAALLKHFTDGFGPLPTLTVEKVGYGMGSRVFPGITSALRVFLTED